MHKDLHTETAITVLFSVAKKMGNLMSILNGLVKKIVVYSYDGILNVLRRDLMIFRKCF